MKKITLNLLVAAAIVLFFFTGCKNENPIIIEYPETGLYGDNILCEQITSVSIGTEYSMKADVPKGGSLKIILKDGEWFYGGETFNWAVTEYNDDNQTQEFTVLVDGKTADLYIEFGDDKLPPAENEVTITVEYYENDAQTPTKVKKLKLNP